jgi:tRNA threonylcarbamoyladenosine biosynthesis protein TsaE
MESKRGVLVEYGSFSTEKLPRFRRRRASKASTRTPLLLSFCYNLPMISKSVEETGKIAQKLAKTTKTKTDQATIITLSGDLGSGKTTFAKVFAENFGIHERDVVSPTFVIMKSYDLDKKKFNFKKFVHIDAYRLEKAEEIEKLGWKNLIDDPKNLILIEWPENIVEAVPKNAKEISFKFIDENTREIVFN